MNVVFRNTVMDPEPVQDKVVWFSDGNIVLRAEQTLFRVYAGILSQASPIFRDMLSIGESQPKGSAETYEGCPLVVMAGDNATDMRTFLRVLHDFRYECLGRTSLHVTTFN